MTTYAIKDWDQTFENRLSRRLASLRYVSITNKQDADAFVQLMRTPSGLIAYGVFIALVQIASKCPERGTLTDDKGDWTPARFSKRFGAPERTVQAAFDLLTSSEIGWLVDAKTVQPAHTERAPTEHEAHTARTSSAQDAQPTKGGTVEYGKVKEGKVRETRPKAVAATPLVVFPKVLDTPAFREAWADWKDDRKANRRKPLTPKGEAVKLAELASWGEADAIAGIKASIGNGWQGIFRPGGSESTPSPGPDKYGCYNPLNFPQKTDDEVCALMEYLYPDTFVRQPWPGEPANAVR